MKYYVVDVFTDESFKGNPAGVCVLDGWPENSLMQNIAFENGLAETAFLTGSNGKYGLKWFTPEHEMDLCGHATLGSAYVALNYLEPALASVEFDSNSGKLFVRRENNAYLMDLPSRMPVRIDIPPALPRALGVNVLEAWQSRDTMAVVESEDAVRNLKADLDLLKEPGELRNFIVTARGGDCDFVSRFFTPGATIPEDPVTGSSHCSLIPYWAKALGKTEMTAKQLSRRGGSLSCRDCGDRVKIGGQARIYLIGEIFV